jgi:hypothetical protein
MAQDRGKVRWMTAVALPDQAPVVATLQQDVHPIMQALWIALRTGCKRHLDNFVNRGGATKVSYEAAHPRGCGKDRPRDHIDHREARGAVRVA